MTRTEAFLPLYASTVFEVEGPLPRGSWWVITAWPPTGTSWPASTVEVADLALRDELTRRGAAPFRVTGSSPDGSHREPGWGATLSEADALHLGRAFCQIALFAIDGDRVTVVDVDTGARTPLDRPFAR
jgi:hypothetical protein